MVFVLMNSRVCTESCSTLFWTDKFLGGVCENSIKAKLTTKEKRKKKLKLRKKLHLKEGLKQEIEVKYNKYQLKNPEPYASI